MRRKVCRSTGRHTLYIASKDIYQPLSVRGDVRPVTRRMPSLGRCGRLRRGLSSWGRSGTRRGSRGGRGPRRGRRTHRGSGLLLLWCRECSRSVRVRRWSRLRRGSTVRVGQRRLAYMSLSLRGRRRGVLVGRWRSSWGGAIRRGNPGDDGLTGRQHSTCLGEGRGSICVGRRRGWTRRLLAKCLRWPG